MDLLSNMLATLRLDASIFLHSTFCREWVIDIAGMNVATFHLVSHGDDGRVNLGNTWLDSNGLSGYASQIAGWNDALGDGADLLIYGCELASNDAGKTLTEALAILCDCDVAASVDDTGYSGLGGGARIRSAGPAGAGAFLRSGRAGGLRRFLGLLVWPLSQVLSLDGCPAA